MSKRKAPEPLRDSDSSNSDTEDEAVEAGQEDLYTVPRNSPQPSGESSATDAAMEELIEEFIRCSQNYVEVFTKAYRQEELKVMKEQEEAEEEAKKKMEEEDGEEKKETDCLMEVEGGSEKD